MKKISFIAFPIILFPAFSLLFIYTISFGASVDCTGSNSADFSCYKTYYTNLVKEKGITAAFDDLKAKYQNSSYIVAQCHPLTHVIGNAASDIYSDPAQAYLHGDSFCWSGYYHGVMDGIVRKKGLKKTLDDLDTICANIPGKDKYSFDYYNCVHGLGHGLMDLTHDEIFKSLSHCNKLKDNWEQQSCGSGVFMENVIADGINHRTKYLNVKKPMYPCTNVEKKYKSPCYLMQTSYILNKITYGDFSKTFQLCSKAESAFRNTCFESLGRDASGRSSSNVLATKTTCLLGKNLEQKEHCLIGAVKDFISYFHSDVQAKTLCDSLGEDGLKSVCLATMDAYYKLL